MDTGILFYKVKERDVAEDIGVCVCGRIILKWILKTFDVKA
jgi:hypothetical protein